MIADEVGAFIGRVVPPVLREVEVGAISRYADATGNGNPPYHDREHAANSTHGTVIAPPGFFGWPMKAVAASTGLPPIVADLQGALARAGFPRILDGGIRYDFYLSVRAGDTLVVSYKVNNITEKQGKSGTMMICDFKSTYLNQNGDLVARSYQGFIAR